MFAWAAWWEVWARSLELDTGSIDEGDVIDNSCPGECAWTKQITPLAAGRTCSVVSNAPLALNHDDKQTSSQLNVNPVSSDMGVPKQVQVPHLSPAVQVFIPTEQ